MPLWQGGSKIRRTYVRCERFASAFRFSYWSVPMSATPNLTPEMIATLVAAGLIPAPQPPATPAFAGGPPIAESARVPAANPAFEAAQRRELATTAPAPKGLTPEWSNTGNPAWMSWDSLLGHAVPNVDAPLTIGSDEYIVVGPYFKGKEGGTITYLTPQQCLAAAVLQRKDSKGGTSFLGFVSLASVLLPTVPTSDTPFQSAVRAMIAPFLPHVGTVKVASGGRRRSGC